MGRLGDEDLSGGVRQQLPVSLYIYFYLSLSLSLSLSVIAPLSYPHWP
jgi:hypothetical protein